MKILIITVVIALLAAFTWFEARPAYARKKCEDKVLMQGLYATTNYERDILERNMVKINEVEEKRSRYHYNKCLHEYGVEK